MVNNDCLFAPPQRVRPPLKFSPSLGANQKFKIASPFPSIPDHQRLNNSPQSVSLKIKSTTQKG